GLADELFRAYLKQILVDGLFHADPHPGNLLFTREHDIALLDCGMVTHVDPATRHTLLRLLLSISDGRGADAATAARALGTPIGDGFDENEFNRRIAQIVMEHRHLPVERLEAGRSIMSIQCVAGETGLRLRNELTMLGKTLMNLDRVVCLLDPKFDPNAALQREATALMQRHTTRDFSLSRVFESTLEATDFVQRLPGRLNRITEMVADNDLRITVDAIDESRLLRGFQKVANRITVGLLLSSIILGASLMMRMEAEWTLFGYPGLAMVFFLVAAIASLILVARIGFDSASKGEA
ncbi:MAG: AarF/ABC1/UbiB kinase family protein, partial [Phycisphaerae bacterium]|nr:AarF/ABC1/UbiB kinase family protein [Phycisphaerae bacterium]